MFPRRNRWLFALLPVCLLLSPAPSLLAQNTFAALHGTVTDTSGAVIPNASVVVRNTGTNISAQTKTDDKGYYVFPQLAASTFLNGAPASTYTVTISATGFQQYQATGLVLNLNDNKDVDASLKVGSSATTVQVQTSAVQVQTSDTQLSTEVTASEIEDMPLLGRDVVQLQKTAPGVAEMSDRFGTFSTDGSQTPQNSFLLDGIDIGDGPLQTPGVTPSPDALAEVNFIDSTLNPEFSRNSGMTVNETIKSGTNSIHGDGFEFYRDTFLTNGSYFSPTRPVFHQNLFGGTLGGPLIKNKLFAFASYQGLRNVAAQTTNTPVFGASTQLVGNFSSDYNESTGALNSAGLSSNPMPFAINGCAAGTPWNSCFTGSTVSISPTQWNSIAAKMTSTFVPAANYSVGGAPYYNFNALNTAGDDQGIARLDYRPAPADAIWFSTLFESNPTTSTLPFIGATVPGFPEDSSLHIKIFNTSWTHTFSPNVLNEFRLGYYRFVFASVEPAPGPGNVAPSSYGFSINPEDAKAVGLPAVSLGDFFTLGFSEDGPQPRNDQNYTANDNFTLVRGNHNIKTGVHIEKFFVDNPFYFLNNGAYAMDGGGLYSSGDPAIDFLMGIPDTYEQTSGGQIDAHSWELFAYAQDNWKASNTLTLNYGLAWDVETPNANEQWSGLGISCWKNTSATTGKFTPESGTALPPGMFFPGDPGCSAYGGTTIRWKDFGPRLGAAWSPEAGPKFLVGRNGLHDFSIRAGFGVYYNRDQEEESLQNLLDPPFAIESQGASDYGAHPGFANPYADVAGGGTFTNKFPFTPAKAGSAVNFENYFPDNLSNVTPGYRPPYTYNYNLNIQRQLSPSTLLQIGYVGSVAHDLPREFEGDPITAAGHAACVASADCSGAYRAVQHLAFPQNATQPALIPGTTVPWYLSIGNQVSDGSSNYNSLQVEVTRAPSHGLTFRLAYTYAHSLDDASGYESSSGAKGVTTNFVPGYEYLNYGDSDYDYRQRLVATYNYQVPIFASWNENRIARETIAGWHFTGITGLQGGFPITFSEGGVFNSLWCDAYSYYGCPDVPQLSSFNIKKLDPRSASHQYFDTSVFSPEPIGTFGNAKRNFFHGPGYNYDDMTLYKDFPLAKENQYVEIRLEAYNAFNHANFAPPSGNLSAGPGNFGYVNNVDQNGTSDPLPGRAVQLVGKIYF
ncbi:MAG: carboxypeptidase-like regulatory domain-containing protein [Acidobacteriaceae bacterium]